MNTQDAARREPLLDVEVRPINEFDVPEVRKLAEDAFRFESIWRRRAWGGLVALHAGKIVGFLVFEKNKASFHILRLVVAPELRQRGIGTKLLEALKARLSVDGQTKILVEVSEENLPAQLFCSKRFTNPGVIRNLYRGRTDGYSFCLKL